MLKAAIDTEIASLLGRKTGERSDYSADELKQVEAQFDEILGAAVQGVFDGG